MKENCPKLLFAIETNLQKPNVSHILLYCKSGAPNLFSKTSSSISRLSGQ